MTAPSTYKAKRCAEKQVLRSQDTAERKAEVMTRMFGRDYAAYRCDVCGLWHLTTRYAKRARLLGGTP